MVSESAKLLREAIDADDVEGVKRLISAQPGLVREHVLWQEPHYKKQRPLTYAAQAGRAKIVALLLEAGADPREDGNLPMARASLNARNIPVLELLVAHGADVNAQAYNWGPIITHPCESLNVAGIRWLLEHGADPNLRFPGQSFDGSPLDLVLGTYGRSPDFHSCVNLLVEAGGKSKYPDGPAMDIHRGRLDLLERRLDAAPSLVHRRFPELDYGTTAHRGLTLSGATLLHVAAEYGDVEAARLLLDRGANVNARAGDGNPTGQTPIFHAVTQYFNWGLPVAEYLIGRGADLTIRATLAGDYEKPGEVIECTPLGYALRYPPSGAFENKAIDLLRSRGAPE
ncbi:MAG: ankyrin repeat domain-containing protein [Planctomycetes bacterium]|nr:ankyrin repeat domain-containing protein [Planctomycetota bacterium]